MIGMILYNLNGVLKILQVPLYASQRVPQLCRRPLVLFPESVDTIMVIKIMMTAMIFVDTFRSYKKTTAIALIQLTRFSRFW